MKSEKFAWLLSIVLVAILAFQIPGTLAHRDDDYSFVRTLIDIHRQVDNHYVEEPDEKKMQQGAIDGMLAQLDPYTNYVNADNQEQFDNMLDGSFRGVGIQLEQNDKGEVVVVTPIDYSPAAKAGVEAGDIITRVNKEDIQHGKLADIMKKVKGEKGTTVTLTVRHEDGVVQDLTMNRDDIIVPTIKGYHRRADFTPGVGDPWDYWVSTDPKIAYIRITQFTSDTFKSLEEASKKLLADGMKGMILDVRFDPGGRLEQAKDVVNLFVREGVIVKVKGRNRPEEITYAKKDAAMVDFPLVVLVNEHSASASEIVAGSLKDNHRALIVGTRTFGKGSVQEVIPLEGKNGELKLTVAYYYLPSGRLVHKKTGSTDWGVVPQLDVPMDADQEKRLMQEQSSWDVIHGPHHKPATNPSTMPATQPAAPFVDRQLAAAVDALTQDIRSGKNTVVPAVPATLPTTRP